MTIPVKMNFDMIIFLVELVLAITALYSAWINLIYKKISKIGLDAFILLFFGKKKSQMIRQDPRLVRRMGIITLLIALGAANEALSVFIGRIWSQI